MNVTGNRSALRTKTEFVKDKFTPRDKDLVFNRFTSIDDFIKMKATGHSTKSIGWPVAVFEWIEIRNKVRKTIVTSQKL